ncbi:unnamed protein product [Camellia sinensis]
MEHGAKKLRKAGQSRWLGRRPVVRGVAMNPVDHPHGGGEGKSKSSGSHGGLREHRGVSLVKVGSRLDHSRKEGRVWFGFHLFVPILIVLLDCLKFDDTLSSKWICHCFCTMHTSRLTFSWNIFCNREARR